MVLENLNILCFTTSTSGKIHIEAINMTSSNYHDGTDVERPPSTNFHQNESDLDRKRVTEQKKITSLQKYPNKSWGTLPVML